MTTFDTAFLAKAWPKLVAQFGETVAYTPHGGSASDISGIWHPGQILTAYYTDGSAEVAVGVLKVSSADVASPDTRDKVVIGGVTWAVKVVERHGATVHLQLETRDQRAIGGAHTRIER